MKNRSDSTRTPDDHGAQDPRDTVVPVVRHTPSGPRAALVQLRHAVPTLLQAIDEHAAAYRSFHEGRQWLEKAEADHPSRPLMQECFTGRKDDLRMARDRLAQAKSDEAEARPLAMVAVRRLGLSMAAFGPTTAELQADPARVQALVEVCGEAIAHLDAEAYGNSTSEASAAGKLKKRWTAKEVRMEAWKIINACGWQGSRNALRRQIGCHRKTLNDAIDSDRQLLRRVTELETATAADRRVRGNPMGASTAAGLISRELDPSVAAQERELRETIADQERDRKAQSRGRMDPKLAV